MVVETSIEHLAQAVDVERGAAMRAGFDSSSRLETSGVEERPPPAFTGDVQNPNRLTTRAETLLHDALLNVLLLKVNIRVPKKDLIETRGKATLFCR